MEEKPNIETNTDSGIIPESKRNKFIKDSWDIILSSQKLLKRRIKRAEKREEMIDMLFAELEKIEDGELCPEEKKNVIRNLSVLRIDDIGKFSAIISSAYDKSALAEGKTTVNVKGEIETTVKKFEDL